ncbi:MAG: flagellar protein FlgN [Chitinispirillaceae bacterium]
MDTTKLYDELIQLLTQENEIHQHLVDIAASMNSIIKKDNVIELQKSSSKYDEHVCILEKVEERRIECCSRIQNALGENVQSNRFASLVGFCEPQQRKKLENLKESLNKRIAELTRINTSNSLLLQEGLGAISRTFDMIRESTQQKNGYRHKGDFSPRTSGISVFNQVM